MFISHETSNPNISTLSLHDALPISSENLVHDYLDLTTNSLLPQEIGQVAHLLRPESLTAHALSSATTSWSRAVAQSTHACADQLHSVAAMLTRIRSDDNSLAAQLRRIL